MTPKEKASEILKKHLKTIFYDCGDLVALEENIEKELEQYAETKVRESLPDIQNIIMRGNISYLGGSADQLEQTDQIAKEVVDFLTTNPKNSKQ
jgi:predicted house-cleaning noncanonical NTP pyrophosphatase (MazG superfamily)